MTNPTQLVAGYTGSNVIPVNVDNSGNIGVNVISGGSTAPAITMTQSTLGMTTSTQQALASNSSAKYRLFTNTSTTDNVYLGVGTAAVNGSGIQLFPGQSYEMALANGNMDTRAVNALLASGTANLLIIEGV